MAVEFHREIFSIPGYLSSPFLTIGFQETNRNGIAEDFDYPDLGALLHAKGVSEVVTLDYFDPRADLRYDLNKPVPVEARSRYRTVCDIGSLEHIFDTKQALENCMAMVTLGGFYFLTTPVKGYYGHGFHTFAPEMLIQVFILNGFEIVYEAYVRATGERIESPDDARNVHIYLVGRRVAHFPEFVIPQQTGWSERYKVQGPPGDLSLGTSEPGTPITKAKVRKVRLHDLRHTSGTHLAASGTLRQTQEWMGHQNHSTTEIYADYLPGEKEAELIDAAFLGGTHIPRDSGVNDVTDSVPAKPEDVPAAR